MRPEDRNGGASVPSFLEEVQDKWPGHRAQVLVAHIIVLECSYAYSLRLSD